MPQFESCKSVLAKILRMPQDTDLTPLIREFQEQVAAIDGGIGNRGRMMTIFLELAADLDLYEYDPLVRENTHILIDELAAQEKIEEALEAVDNIEKIMPWLQNG